jgi:hypothetical protein
MTLFRWRAYALTFVYTLPFVTAETVGVVAMIAQLDVAQAHGAAAWVMQNPETRYCCGPQDCEMLRDGQVQRLRDGYLVQIPNGEPELIPDGDARIHWSIDEHYWICRFPDGRNAGHARCLFPPTLGM